MDGFINCPSWWRTPEQQLERARRLWPNAVLPEPPEGFIPRTESEVLLLHVPEGFNELWEEVAVPPGYVKNRQGIMAEDLRLAPNKCEFGEPVWLGFDPEYGRGKRPDSLWGDPGLAASEVLSALIQFPEWFQMWILYGTSYPCIAGYWLENKERGLALVPALGRWVDSRKPHDELRMFGIRADDADPAWSSPSVREC